ncbi:hypothetical protein LCGC14_1135060 [marine sediment metagenome]|uniref:Uncharacterized protein n=1 Tax=marine sediment metagenome TaxID=412755 RepID=A0A0F9PI56_9ZZZZ
MKNFTYYNINKINLHIDGCEWLEEMGFKETQWILDTEWLLTQTSRLTFKEWINE